MKKIAIISDIHSNLFALESVMNDIHKQNIDEIYNAGDTIGYHSRPDETVTFIRNHITQSVMGNHDYDIANGKYHEIPGDIKFWTYTRLSEENRTWLKNLPLQIHLEKEGLKITITHGSPNSLTEYLYETSENTTEAMNNFDGDILISAHTHYPYIKKFDSKTIINTGSVGKPKIGKPVSSYIILTFESFRKFNTEIKYVSYNHQAASEDMISKGLSSKHAKELLTGSAE